MEMYRRDTTARKLLDDVSRHNVGYQVEHVYALYGNPEQYVQAQQVAVAELKVAKAAMPPKQDEILEGYSKQLDETAEIPESELTYGKELGRGAFGTVLRAGWKEAQVAVKVLAKISKTASKHFIQEVALMLKFKHAGIVQVHGWTKRDASLGLVMELMCDGSLHDQIHVALDAETALTLPLKISIARQVTSALAYLHDDCDMAHRDIKPHNVLLSFAEDNASIKAKLCDFGFVKVRNGVRASTASLAAAIFVGTPGYAAPEDFEEQVKDDDVSGWKMCDVYAMGVLLWELFEEDEPYWGHSATAIKKMVIAGKTLELSDTPAAYRPILTSMWQLDASARPRMTSVVAAVTMDTVQKLPVPVDADPVPIIKKVEPSPRPVKEASAEVTAQELPVTVEAPVSTTKAEPASPQPVKEAIASAEAEEVAEVEEVLASPEAEEVEVEEVALAQASREPEHQPTAEIMPWQLPRYSVVLACILAYILHTLLMK
jgi:serine/threonine protein kinase